MTARTPHARWGRSIRCGPFVGERYGTSLRWLHAGSGECMRMVALVVRDRAWRTPVPDPASVRIRSARDRIDIAARTRVGAGVLRWRLHVAARSSGLDVEATLTAEGDVTTNRAGLVVLLPADVYAGARFRALHADGTRSRGMLPLAIAPHQPMLDLSVARFDCRDGTALAMRFEGDVFEMEDQRNWLDPTFKLYSRSLARPVPYRIRDGQTIAQRIAVTLERQGSPRAAIDRDSRGRLPRLGVATAGRRIPSDASVVTSVHDARPAFVLHRVERAADVRAARSFAASVGAETRLECFSADDGIADAIASAPPAAIALHRLDDADRRRLREAASGAMRIGGTFADFVMLNREGIDGDAQGAAFALCPTVHARDDRSLVETLDALPRVFAQARRIAGRRPLAAGPCSLLRRLAPRTGRPADRPWSRQGVPYDVDVRQGEPIAAAWLACAIAIAAAARVESLCTFEASGARGLVGAVERFPVPRSMARGRRTPSHAVLCALAERPGAAIILHRVDPFVGAAFTIALAQRELWLVELAGRARPLPAAVERRNGLALARAARGAAWRRAKSRVHAYGIVRVPVDDATPAEARRLANDWCQAA